MTRDDPKQQQQPGVGGGDEAAANNYSSSSLAGGGDDGDDGITLTETSEAESGIVPLDAATTSSDAAVVLPPPTEYLRPNNNNNNNSSAKKMGDNSNGGDGGGDGSSSNSEQRQPSLSSSGAVDATAAALAGGQHYIHAHARRRHHRKRTLSKANSSGTLETSGSMAMAEDDENGRSRSGSNNHSGHHHHHHHHNLSSSGGSLMNSSTIGSNIMGGRAEHSIVSFGRNFNFDSTSSPSNSDSGEGAVHDGKGSNSDDDSNNRNSKSGAGGGDDCVPSILHTNATSGGGGGEDMQKKPKKHHSHHRRGGGGDSNSNAAHNNNNNNNSSNPNSKDGEIDQSGGGSSGKKSKKSSSSKQNASVKFVPEAATTAGSSCALQTTGEEESGSSSTSSGSDSSRNNDSGGSASGGSNSMNDGSSGGKSTISSLTTSSNQEWMASNEKGNIVGGVVASADAQISTSTGETVGAQSSCVGNGQRGGSDGQLNRTKKTGEVSGKKRKKSSSDVGPNEEDHKSEEDDDGYKTDEEQWGGNHLVDGLPTGCGPLVAHKGSSPKVPKTASSVSKMISTGSVADPRTKQARFSVDHQHPKGVGSVDALTQPLSSLSGSDSAGNPGAVTNSSSAPSLSKSVAVDMTSRSNARGVSEPSSGGFATKLNDHPIAHAGGVEPDKRKERNAREKERSCRIARQIDDLRALLSRGGVVVSKGTKSSVLAEAANYINLLQQQQVQWEMERQAMMQQMQQVRVIPNPIMKQSNLQQSANSMGPASVGGSGVIPQQMALAVQPTTTGQVGILPMTALPPPPPPQAPPSASTSGVTQNDYKFIFNNSSVGMAIASLGGAFIDCNSIFCQLSEYTKEEVCAMTIFNMTSRQDLQHAFDLISQMITPALDNGSEKGEDKSSIVLRGAMKKRTDLGLNISLIKGEHGIVKCFCVTLIRILSIKATRPDTVSIETELPQVWSTKQQKNVGFGSSPAYTSG